MQMHIFTEDSKCMAELFKKIQEDCSNKIKNLSIFTKYSLTEEKNYKNLAEDLTKTDPNAVLFYQKVYEYYRQIKKDEELFQIKVKYVSIALQDDNRLKDKLKAYIDKLLPNEKQELKQKINKDEENIYLFSFYEEYVKVLLKNIKEQ